MTYLTLVRIHNIFRMIRSPIINFYLFSSSFFLTEKARILEKAGAKGGIVIDNNKGSTSTNSPLFSMSGDGVDDVSIPMVFVFYNDAKDILEALKSRPKMEASLLDSSGKYLAQYSLPPCLAFIQL